jgi:FkbM family methyltransferase
MSAVKPNSHWLTAGRMEQTKAAAINWLSDRPNWRQRLRTLIVSRGVRVICGSADYVSADYASDIPLFRGAARLLWLKALGALGIKNFITTSGLGYDFVCHTGDLANFPFYDRKAYRPELQLCFGWLQGEDSPVVYDIGANDGFLSTHLAQMLAGRTPKIYAFEPTPATFAKLAQSVERLGLNDSVYPVAAAVIDSPRPVQISYSERNSLLAQIRPLGLNPRSGEKTAAAEGVTLDGFSNSSGNLPKLIKIDAEGSEAAVFRGAQRLLSAPDRPAILFECNSATLAECGDSVATLSNLLPGYDLYYVNDYCGQKIPFGYPVENPDQIDWVCNLFAVPATESAGRRWAAVLKHWR